MLGDQFADHLEMAELLHRDVLQHVADARVLDVERLHPVLQRRRQLARGAAELFEEECAETRVRRADVDRMDQLFSV